MEQPPGIIKPCKRCGRPRPSNSTLCTICQGERKKYDKSYFQKHVVEKSASASQVKRNLLDWYNALKHHKSCVDCGFQGEACQMDFDHLPGFKKFMEISKMVRLGYTKEKILAEVA